MSIVRVTTGSRLHFGLTAFGRAEGRQFGGVGAMIDAPRCIVEFRSHTSWQVAGPHAERVTEWAQRYAAAVGKPQLPCVAVTIDAAPEMHAGLGAGTQLALAVAAGLARWAEEDSPTVEQLALRVGRAARSAIGTHGFAQGGLIRDGGKLPNDAVGTLAERLAIPAEWRFLLVCPRRLSGVSGEREARAFREMPAVSRETETRLEREMADDLLPAVRGGEFSRFAESLYRYNRLAGQCYAAWQGSPYAAPRLESLVESLRRLGHAGVGQSSWGPTLFVALPDVAAAETLAAELRGDPAHADLDLLIAPPRNLGATIAVD